MRALCFASILSFVLAASGVVTVIDDLNGDPSNGNKISFLPQGAWDANNIASCGQNCQLPNLTMAYESTYTGGFFNSSNRGAQPSNATVPFVGTSVSVQCILSNSLAHPNGRSEMLFYVDGILVHTYQNNPTGSGEFFNSTVFATNGLVPGKHVLIIQNGAVNGKVSLAILDSVSYSSDEDLTTQSPPSLGSATVSAAPTASGTANAIVSAKSSKAAPIVGAIVGLLAVLLLLLLAFLYVRQRRKQHKSNVPLSQTMFSPFRDIWSAARRSSKPQLDMAPVPFPAPQPVSAPPRAPRTRTQHRHTAPAAPSSSRFSRISFNPNLLVGRMRRTVPPPIVTTHPDPRAGTSSPAIPSGNPLIRQASLMPENIASIQAWQQQTHQATATAGPPAVHPLDMSEVDLSSHYDESSVSPPPAPPVAAPRSPQPQRRFTVMNN